MFFSQNFHLYFTSDKQLIVAVHWVCKRCVSFCCDDQSLDRSLKPIQRDTEI